MSYGARFHAGSRTVARGIYAGRSCRARSLPDLPVQLVTKVELVVNLKAAKLLGHPFSAASVAGADEGIERKPSNAERPDRLTRT